MYLRVPRDRPERYKTGECHKAHHTEKQNELCQLR
jgi:hypothetical protein